MEMNFRRSFKLVDNGDLTQNLHSLHYQNGILFDEFDLGNIEGILIKLKKQKEIIDKAIEYITSYESISTIQGSSCEGANKNFDEKTMTEMTNRYLSFHDKLLQILKDKENGEWR